MCCVAHCCWLCRKSLLLLSSKDHPVVMVKQIAAAAQDALKAVAQLKDVGTKCAPEEEAEVPDAKR